ncbi:MAG: hypothetical protein M1817_006328 [Caeruleum heppii]|nr:MAG: hypothetical protein M1817_006328 [Caeruleum heppii]
MTALRACIRRSKGKATRAVLPHIAGEETQVLQMLVSQCRALEILDIRGSCLGVEVLHAATLAPKLQSLRVGGQTVVDLKGVVFLLRCCPLLECAEFHSVRGLRGEVLWPPTLPKLKRLCLVASEEQEMHTLALNMEPLIRCTSEVQELFTAGWKGWSLEFDSDFRPLARLETLDLRGTQLAFFPRLPSSIRRLNLSAMHRVRLALQPSEGFLRESHLPLLEKLCWSDWSELRAAQLLQILRPSKGRLRELDDGYLDNVLELNLGGLDIDDDCVALLSDSCRQLMRLDLSKTKVTGIGIKALLTRENSRLGALLLNHCTYISSDAIDFARSKGLTVEWLHPEKLRGAKRVRLC